MARTSRSLPLAGPRSSLLPESMRKPKTAPPTTASSTTGMATNLTTCPALESPPAPRETGLGPDGAPKAPAMPPGAARAAGADDGAHALAGLKVEAAGHADDGAGEQVRAARRATGGRAGGRGRGGGNDGCAALGDRGRGVVGDVVFGVERVRVRRG